MKTVSANCDFLGKQDTQPVRLGALAKRYFKDDPNTCRIKLRQFRELLAQLAAAKSCSSGWEVDTQSIRYIAGSRPVKGHSLAIAEWPTKSGPADYALFVGTKSIGVVEAKRRNKNVSSHIDQAQRYARGFHFEGGAEPVGGPWNDSGDKKFFVPFVFSANGRPFLKQIETES